MTSIQNDFEAVIGLEVHAQLATDSKIFCGCRARLLGGHGGESVADVAVNLNTCPVCSGHPGALPVLNRKAVEFAIMAGLATHCRINPRSVFARKSYFYPDLPKGYQISQYDQPICEAGWLEISTSATPKKIRIDRIHMEEDAGKNIHLSGFSVVNLNRAGVPLIEIVSAPDMRTAEEAGAYLRALHGVVTYLGICDGNMQEGNFRCDANVSVMPKGAKEFGTRAEIKNVNSFRFIEKAIEFEIRRQIEVLRAGGRVVQETRGYDSARNVTVSLRTKEEAQDYRYFPDPDLIPLRIEDSWVVSIQSMIPELPAQKFARFISEFGLSQYDADVLIASKTVAEFYEECVGILRVAYPDPFDLRAASKAAANWTTGELMRLLNEEGRELSASKIRSEHIADLVRLTQSRVVSSTGAKQALGVAWKTGESIETIVEREGLRQVSDTGALEVSIDKIIAGFPAQVAEYKAGKEKIIGFLVGQVMKQSGGKANPSLVQELLKKKLS
ncbi:MAG: aspartyl/glutamyl-tRNA amidotransferase subunit B [Bdellovibrionales bacterium RIFOXYC1_FULL_54_43]|nr:MAG: aspartyl/glutamyl-tRNA amidotransferase subunit B [Bdellovibrionales bacterium RIFOXYC1_FULL_54_43]OFZ81557.1 MAG: aspartyl/glutamyl-tRNA amidotransferase subunit B [Bdellovibrionales bacterium RIFOXYD1_FULL_55_31]